MNFLRRFMMGRYGGDLLNNVFLVGALASMVLQWVTRWRIMGIFTLVFLILCYARMFSRNIPARYAENQRLLNWWLPMRERLNGARARFADRKTHRYYKCPQCGKRLRVPRGRGKINITCPACQREFVKKT